MKNPKMNLLLILIGLSFIILVPSFALISSSQSNDTSSDDTPSDFSSMSRENAENQSEGQSIQSDGDNN